LAGLKEVAQLAGVSSATVSRVLSDKPHIRPIVRQRVLDAVKALGYKPNHVARSLRVQSSKIIGLIISDIQNPFFTSLVRAVEDVAYANGYAIFLCNSDEELSKESFYFDLMLAEKVAGVIFTPTSEVNCACRRLVESNKPVVSVDRRIIDYPLDTIILDNFNAAKSLIDHLYEDGHRSVAAVMASPRMTTGRERYEGYIASIKSHNLPINKHFIYQGSPKEEFGFQSTLELLDLPEPPSAIFTGNNLLMLGAYRAIRQRGLRIPLDIGLVGFDDMEWASLIEPPLTVIPQPSYELGELATDLILKRIENPSRPVQEIILKPQMCIRRSCGTHYNTPPNH